MLENKAPAIGKRSNRDRVAAERAAQQQPMYTKKRPSTGGRGSGCGAAGLPMILVTSGLLALRRRKRNLI